jgi:hypothetical protein
VTLGLARTVPGVAVGHTRPIARLGRGRWGPHRQTGTAPTRCRTQFVPVGVRLSAVGERRSDRSEKHQTHWRGYPLNIPT